MRAEYDFYGRGSWKVRKRYTAGSNVVVLDSDVAEMFPTSRVVNSTLRMLGETAQRKARRVRTR